MTNERKSHKDLFLELATPDELGFSRAVNVNEFTNEYAVLKMGNGGSWCRSDGSLGRKYNIRRHKKGKGIVSVELQGYKKQPIGKHIPAHIKQKIVNKRCVILDIGNRIECDHKDGRLDDPRLDDPAKISIADFQPLSKAVNNAKRQHCKKCRQTNERFDARVLGYKVAQVKADSEYNGSCIGCYWHDPHFFNMEISKSWSK